MGIQIISKRERVEVVRYVLRFDNLEVRGAAYQFDCDEHGKLKGDEYATVEQREQQVAEVKADPKFDAGYVDRQTHSYIEDAVGKCSCGAKVYLSDPLDNECERCHRWYNMVGQEVVNPNSELGRNLRAEDDRYADDDY